MCEYIYNRNLKVRLLGPVGYQDRTPSPGWYHGISTSKINLKYKYPEGSDPWTRILARWLSHFMDESGIFLVRRS